VVFDAIPSGLLQLLRSANAVDLNITFDFNLRLEGISIVDKNATIISSDRFVVHIEFLQLKVSGIHVFRALSGRRFLWFPGNTVSLIRFVRFHLKLFMVFIQLIRS